MVTGFFLGIDAAAYWALTGAAVAGGVAGGFEHRAPGSAAMRGVVAGTLFGAGVVVADAVSKQPALAPLPSPPILLVPLSAAIGAGLHALGGTARRRADSPTSR
jgi:hypothetical protein